MTRLVPAIIVLIAAVAQAADTPLPTMEGPVASAAGAFVAVTTFDPASVGYVEEEYFLSGTARAFTSTGPLGEDGMWSVTPGETADYKTRIVVLRPAKARKFDGTVFVEWLNVSGGVDAGPDWTFAHDELIREGAAWVGVSAQKLGIEGGTPLLPLGVSLPLKQVNPARYGSLRHPGDSFSYDIYSQAAAIVRAGTSGPFGKLRVRRVIAVGESQSAFRMVNYVDAIQPVARLFDGFFIHSRGSISLFSPLSEAPQPAIPVPGAARIRADLDVPVLTFETETDVEFLGYFAARQDDTTRFRLWEVAGTAHADTYQLVTGRTDTGHDPKVNDIVLTRDAIPGVLPACSTTINSGPQHFVIDAAFAALDRWVRTGRPPKPVPRLDVDAGPPVAIRRDGNGNALGGARTPQVDVPLATFTGAQADPTLACGIFGSTAPFDAATVARLYPKRRDFVSAYAKAIRRAQKAGLLVAADARLLRKWLAGSTVGR